MRSATRAGRAMSRKKVRGARGAKRTICRGFLRARANLRAASDIRSARKKSRPYVSRVRRRIRRGRTRRMLTVIAERARHVALVRSRAITDAFSLFAAVNSNIWSEPCVRARTSLLSICTRSSIKFAPTSRAYPARRNSSSASSNAVAFSHRRHYLRVLP